MASPLVVGPLVVDSLVGPGSADANIRYVGDGDAKSRG